MNRRKFCVCIGMILLVCLGQSSSAQYITVPFPLGLMGPSVDNFPPSLGLLSEKLADVSAGGFNAVYEFRSHQDISGAEDYLSQASAVRLQVIQNLPTCRAYENDLTECLNDPVDIWTEAEWATFISTLSTHDNLIAWYLPDEIRDLGAAANLYEWVHTYDPLDRPVYANPGTLEQAVVNQFPNFTDFLWVACYPEHYGEPRALVTYCMNVDAAATRGTDVKYGAILQYFDNSAFGQAPHHPTARELRADSYQAIIGGARGLWYFNYEMGRILDDNLWEAISAVANEIAGTGGLDDVILAPDVPQGIVKRIVSGPTQSPPVYGKIYDSIQTLQEWREGDGTYLFAVNVATDTVRVEFSNLLAETDTVQVLFEPRTIPITDDHFSDTFVPDDVHIYFYAASHPARPPIFLPLVVRNAGFSVGGAGRCRRSFGF